MATYVVESVDEPASKSGRFVVESVPEHRSAADNMARGIGLGTRSTINGVLGLPLMALDAGIAAGNLVNRGTNAIGLTHAGQMPSASELNDRFLTMLGVAEPENATERVASDIQTAATGAGALAKVADLIKGRVPEGVERVVLDLLSKAPGVQIASGALGGAAAGGTREAGGGPASQLAAGLVGGVAPVALAGGATVTAGAAGRAIRELPKPFTQSGRQDIVGATLRRLATDPDAAAASLATGADEIIPGSLSTTAQAARDLGLLQAERALASTDSKFAARASANNAARNRALDTVARTDGDLNAAMGARLAEGNKLYGEAFSQPLRPDAPLDPLLVLSQRPAFQSALKKAAEIAQESGDDKLDILLDPKGLHYVKMALDDMISTAPMSGIGKAQRRAIAQTRADFITWLEDASPAYAKARALYAEASRPISQMKIGQRIRQQTSVAAPDVSGENIISQAKWKNVVTNKLGEIEADLTPDQVKTLTSIGNDLDRGVLSQSAGKAAGSNTFQNLSTANVIGAALGGGIADNALLQTAMRPAQWLYKLPEAKVQDLLTEAMLDPKLARALMMRGTRGNVDFALAALKDKAKQMGMLSTVEATTGASITTSPAP